MVKAPRPFDARRDTRVIASVPLRLLRLTASEGLVTSDVSARGLFVPHRQVLEQREFVRFAVALPPSGASVLLSGAVAHVQAGDAEQPPGSGIELYGIGEQERRMWEAFVLHVQVEQAALAAGDAGQSAARAAFFSTVPAASAKAAARPRFETAVEVTVHFHDVADLLATYRRELALGWLVVSCAAGLEAGARLRVTLVHPLTQARLTLGCSVSYVLQDRSTRGMGLTLERQDDAARRELWQFITAVGAAALQRP